MATRPDESTIYDELRGTPTQPQVGYTWDDLLELPEGHTRHEIIDGELIVTPTPATRHQRVAQTLAVALDAYQKGHGGFGLGLPINTYLSERDVVEPDCVYVRPENVGRVEYQRIVGPPDLIIEISSPSTRRLDLMRKRDLYERYDLPEYWFVDLDGDNVQVYRLLEGQYGTAYIGTRGRVLDSPLLPGLSINVDELLGAPD